MVSTLTEKGQITVPKPLRDALGLRPGDRLDFAEDHGRIVVTKASLTDPVTAAYGSLDLGRSTDAAIAELRGEPDAV